MSFRLTATDGYFVTLTYDQVFGNQYAYSSHTPAASSGARAVEPVVSWEWGDPGRVRPERIRLVTGHVGPMVVNTAASVRDLSRIEVLSASAGAWETPGASIADGATVEAGTELQLTHSMMDSVRVYYTLDGTEPNLTSAVYNPSTSYFQPHLIVPLVLTESLTIKAFAAGMGRDPSPVVVFSITVSG